MRELFIYYRVRAGDAPAALRVVQSLQADLRARHPQLRTRLLQRPETDQDLQTWMETYATEPTAGGIDADLQADIEASSGAMLTLIQGLRHTEVFIACAS